MADLRLQEEEDADKVTDEMIRNSWYGEDGGGTNTTGQRPPLPLRAETPHHGRPAAPEEADADEVTDEMIRNSWYGEDGGGTNTGGTTASSSLSAQKPLTLADLRLQEEADADEVTDEMIRNSWYGEDGGGTNTSGSTASSSPSPRRNPHPGRPAAPGAKRSEAEIAFAELRLGWNEGETAETAPLRKIRVRCIILPNQPAPPMKKRMVILKKPSIRSSKATIRTT
jgi:hypothetical protein